MLFCAGCICLNVCQHANQPCCRPETKLQADKEMWVDQPYECNEKCQDSVPTYNVHTYRPYLLLAVAQTCKPLPDTQAHMPTRYTVPVGSCCSFGLHRGLLLLHSWSLLKTNAPISWIPCEVLSKSLPKSFPLILTNILLFICPHEDAAIFLYELPHF